MELYSQSPTASMSMQEDPDLNDHLIRLMRTAKIDVAIETGTFLGQGSTRSIANCFLQSYPPKRFVTIEVNFSNWCRAKASLRVFPFVDCRWGSAVGVEAAVKFIQADEMLINHEKYKGIYIDNIDNPVEYYTREVRSLMEWSENIQFDNQAKAWLSDGDDILTRLLKTHADHRPLIILDSAGGIGLMEFQIVLEQMKDKPYFLLLDDTHHIKHYRSLQHILASPAFEVIAQSESWALACHAGGQNFGKPLMPPKQPPSDFDPSSYLRHNPDVATAGMDPAAHFLSWGWREGRVWR